MDMSIFTILYILIAVYLMFIVFTKVTKWVLRIAILALIFAVFFYGYTNIEQLPFFHTETGKEAGVLIGLNETLMNETGLAEANITNTTAPAETLTNQTG